MRLMLAVANTTNCIAITLSPLLLYTDRLILNALKQRTSRTTSEIAIDANKLSRNVVSFDERCSQSRYEPTIGTTIGRKNELTRRSYVNTNVRTSVAGATANFRLKVSIQSMSGINLRQRTTTPVSAVSAGNPRLL